MSAEADELVQLTADRDRLEHEQDRLMQARHADTIPLAVLEEDDQLRVENARPFDMLLDSAVNADALT